MNLLNNVSGKRKGLLIQIKHRTVNMYVHFGKTSEGIRGYQEESGKMQNRNFKKRSKTVITFNDFMILVQSN